MLAQGVFEASQLHLRIPAHPALRIAGAQRSQIKDRKQKTTNLEFFPIVPGHLTPVCSKVQGITAVDLIRMLDSGMRISDFLNATNVFAKSGHTIDRDFS